MSSTAEMSVRLRAPVDADLASSRAVAAMVYVDNKVALRQLQTANQELLSRTSLRSFAGQSLAKDGKFHPRVLTLVGHACAFLQWEMYLTFFLVALIFSGWRPYYHPAFTSRCCGNLWACKVSRLLCA